MHVHDNRLHSILTPRGHGGLHRTNLARLVQRAKTTMSPILGKAFGFQLKSLMHSAARQIASAISASAGQGTLPTKAQLTKMGPQNAFQRGSPQRNDW